MPLCNEVSVLKPGLSAPGAKAIAESTNPPVHARPADDLYFVGNLHAVDRVRAGIRQRYIRAVPVNTVVVIVPEPTPVKSVVVKGRAASWEFGEVRHV